MPPRIAGDLQFVSGVVPGWSLDGRFDDPREHKPFGPLPRDHARYRGLYLHGRRVVLSYSVGNRLVWETPWIETVDDIPVFSRTIEVAPGPGPITMRVCEDDAHAVLVGPPLSGVKLDTTPGMPGIGAFSQIQVAASGHPVVFKVALVARKQADPGRLGEIVARLVPAASPKRYLEKGPARWTAPLTTRGQVTATGGPFVVDSVTLPFHNPYHALFFVSGHDFFTNGDAAICTVHGDVWRVSGIDDELREVRWKRFATGLFQPLGLRIVQDTVYVTGRDQITRLHDLDQNGEADYYENFNNEGHVSTNGHEYVTCLETDRNGNFYFLKGDSGSRTRHDGCLLRVSADGERLDVFASGLRNANGLSIGPEDQITVAPQEGEWTPASGLFRVREGGFYGAMQVHHQSTPPTGYQPPLCWLPRRVDNSSGGQVWIPESSWNGLGGRMIHFSYGQCTMMLVLEETTPAGRQGAAVPFPMQFDSGVMRGRFRPQDGHLYVSGLRGWASSSAQDGCFQRVRYVGGPIAMPARFKTYANGIALTFPEMIDQELAEDADNYQLEQWNYRWSAQYGSPELKPSQPHVEGRDKLPVESVSLLPDGRTVFLELSQLQPVSQLAMQFRAAATDQVPQAVRFYATIHEVPAEAMSLEGLSRSRSRSQLSLEERSRLAPGLLVRFEQPDDGSTRRDTVRRRLAAIQVPEGHAPTEMLRPGPFRAVFEGYVRVPEPGMYRVRCAGSGAARVRMNGHLVAALGTSPPGAPSTGTEPAEHAIRGDVKLHIEFEHATPRQTAAFQLLWQPRDGIEEPVPPTVLWSQAEDRLLQNSDQIKHGRDALAEHRCFRCHDADTRPGLAEGHSPPDGPSLADAGSRLKASWIAQWLLQPDALRNDTRMPQLLGDPSSATARQHAADLSEFLSTLKVRRHTNSGRPAGDARQGARRWESLGCLGCHRLTPPGESDAYDRVSLRFVAAKYSREGLTDYLLAPHSHFAATRMPDLRLAEVEASDLAAFLAENSSSMVETDAPLPSGDEAAGRRLAVELRCGNCHELGIPFPRASADVPVGARIHDGKSLSGCLSESESPGGRSPRYTIRGDRRQALQAAWNEAGSTPVNGCAADQAERIFRNLRCGACHGRDDKPSRLPTILAEESETGLIPETLPDLTWAGERLKTQWLQRFVAGEIVDRPRQHLSSRMPAFPAHAGTVAHGFAMQHGVGIDDDSATLVTGMPQDLLAASERRIIGYQLTQKQGLDCRQCHAVGHEGVTGDERTRVAPGINFTQVRQRLRYDFYRRFVLDPPRYDINSKMPKLSADGRSTNLQHVLDGNAQEQFHAIWTYLQTLHGDEP